MEPKMPNGKCPIRFYQFQYGCRNRIQLKLLAVKWATVEIIFGLRHLQIN